MRTWEQLLIVSGTFDSNSIRHEGSMMDGANHLGNDSNAIAYKRESASGEGNRKRELQKGTLVQKGTL
jgi:hypothetical protein